MNLVALRRNKSFIIHFPHERKTVMKEILGIMEGKEGISALWVGSTSLRLMQDSSEKPILLSLKLFNMPLHEA